MVEPKKRIYWIDAAKGVLILLMVLGHISNIAGRRGVDDTYLVKCVFYTSLYTCFFMQAFLILTGYTSNFNKDFKSFFISLVKTVVIPWTFFSVISQICRVLVLGEDYLFVPIDGQRFLFIIEDFWFLHVLFGGKLIYYFINKYIKSDLYRCLTCIALMIIGFALFAHSASLGFGYHHNNFFHYKDLLCMVFSLWLGSFCKRKNIFDTLHGKTLVVIISLYLLGHALRLFLRIKGIDNMFITPVGLSHGTNIHSILQIPTYLFYVILGSFSFFGLMKYVKKCDILKYFGENSLVVYCSHFIILNAIVLLLIPVYTPDSLVKAIIYTVVVFVSCLFFCSVLIWITKKKPFNYLIGKF